MLCRKSDHHLNALRRGNRTKRPTAQTRHPGQWLVPRTSRGATDAWSCNGRKCYLKLHTGVVLCCRAQSRDTLARSQQFNRQLSHAQASAARMSRASSSLQNPPSLVEHGKLRFMIMDSPTGQPVVQSWMGGWGRESRHGCALEASPSAPLHPPPRGCTRPSPWN